MCLSNLIGIDNICSKGSFEYYINDLSGISIQTGDSIVSEEESSIVLFEKKKRLAEEILNADIFKYFDNKIISKTLIESNTVGITQENLQKVDPIINTIGGILIESNVLFNKNLFFDKAYVNISTAEDLIFYIIDLKTGIKIKEVEFTTIPNTPTEVNLNFNYQSNSNIVQLFFGYDSEHENNLTRLDYNSRSGCSSCSGHYKNEYVSVYQGRLNQEPWVRENFNTENNTSGVSLNYSLECAINSFICKNARSLSLAYLFKVGELILEEAIYSTRNNSVTLQDSEELSVLSEKYRSEYERHFSTSVKRLSLPKNDPCFRCFGPIKSVVRLPR